MKLKLARRTDPRTSHTAAQMLDLSRTEKQQMIVDWLIEGPMTDMEMAERAVAEGLFAKDEQARRAVRTAREEHGMMVPAYDAHGERIVHYNSTGRPAECWTFA